MPRFSLPCRILVVHRFIRRVALTVTALAFLLCTSQLALAQVPAAWTTTGSSGVTEDESNPARPTYTNFTAAANAGSPAGAYILRYNIQATDSLTVAGATNTRLRVRFRDEGAGSRVVVAIIRSPITGGATSIGTLFDSDTFAPGSGFQTQEILMPALVFNFSQNTYWLEVTLTKASTSNQPGFGSAQIIQQPPSINLVKLTNGTDNDTAPGIFVPIGSTVTFTYIVTNPSSVPFSGVTVRDDNGTPGNPADDFNATFVGGDTNTNGLLDTTETWTFTASRIATAGQYTNTGTATGTPPTGPNVTDTNADNHFGSAAGINLVKLTNGTDNDTAPGIFVPVGSTVTFTYIVTNTGNVPLSGVTVTDDAGTPGNPADNFSATFVGGDTNANGLLDTAETWTFTAGRIATAGQYTNTGSVTGTPPPGAGPSASDTNVDNHFGASPAINLVKLTNGTDNDSAPGLVVPIGSTVTFTYIVTNTGNVPLSGVTVRDDNGTPGNPADDFNATFVGGDTNANGLLDTTETWTFTASRIATAGQYTNTGTTTGTPPPGAGAAVSDTNVDNHFGS